MYGLKDSSGDRRYFREVQQAMSGKPEFALLVGVEEALAEFVGFGAHGGVCGGSNLEPELYVRICDAAAQGDRSCVEKILDTHRVSESDLSRRKRRVSKSLSFSRIRDPWVKQNGRGRGSRAATGMEKTL